MSETAPTEYDYPEVDASEIKNVPAEREMEQSYIDYAMSVIAGRALPDVRDGLKPVHRRILYAMHGEGITSRSGHRKSSSVVGETMGNFHPHGDSAIYDTLVRMAQDFSMRYPLVDGQGNFGSIDGDPAAAMRYTEARMAPIAEELLTDIDKDTVDWESNYDDRLEEPEVLPAAFPNLLVNGSSGIAVGMSTNIPPHNLGEIIDATVELIDNPEASVEDLMEHVRGPDFPTGGKIVGKSPIRSAYKTGRGKVRLRGEIEIDEDERRIVITEIPYQVDKSDLVEKIAELADEGRIEGVSSLRDESDRDGIRVVVDLKRNAVAEVVKNQLLDNTRLETTFGIINLALVDGQPRVLDLKQTLEEYIDHRKEVVRRRSEHDLEEAKDRAHILEGRLRAVENADEIVETIRNSEDRDEAKNEIVERGFSEEQADHVVRMQLGSLTSLEADEIESEYSGVQDDIDRLEAVLADESELMSLIKEELLDIKREYADERKTRIETGEDEVTDEDLIPERDVFVVLTRDGYVKRMSPDEFDTQRRGGKGIIGAKVKEDDGVVEAFTANTHDYLLVFTDLGNVHWLKTYQIPEMSRTARGRSIVNLLELEDGENVTAVESVEGFEDDDASLCAVTREGRIKRTSLEAFSNPRTGGIIAADLEGDDVVVDTCVTDPDVDERIVVETRDGMVICFDEEEVREMGRNARGVKAVDLQDGDEVVSVFTSETDWDDEILTVTTDGYAKRTPQPEYRCQSRGGKGLIDIDIDVDADDGEARKGVTASYKIKGNEGVVAVSEEGQVLRTTAEEVSEVGRNTQGVILMRLEDDDQVASVCLIEDEDNEDNDAAEIDG